MSFVQFIERNGQPEFAVVPIELWRRLAAHAQVLVDDTAVERGRYRDASIRAPQEVIDAESAGVHPVKAWREYRTLTQEQLAASAGISKPFLSQIENGKRRGTITVLSALSQALSVPVDALMPN